MLSDADLHNLTMDSDETMRLVACELELARKVIGKARDHGRWCSIKLSCQLCAAMREYDAGETSETQPEQRSEFERGWRAAAMFTDRDDILCDIGSPWYQTAERCMDTDLSSRLTAVVQPRKPSFAEALEHELSGRSDGSQPMSWAAMWACVERARRASGE